jgi:hypothetical protein
MSNINSDSVNKLFTTTGEDVWRCVSYAGEPTARFENVETKEQIGGTVSSRNVVQFKPLGVVKP